MNMTELRYLVAIRKFGSVSAAAKQLYVAQPNMSKALKNLEAEYDIRIFERSSTGMIPTEQGQRFIDRAQRVLDEIDRLEADARHQQGDYTELRVMIPHATYASYAAVEFLQQVNSPELQVCIREGGATEALDAIQRQGYHLALLRYAQEDEEYYDRYCRHHGLCQETILEFEYQLLTSRTGVLAKQDIQTLAQLNGYTQILHGDFLMPGEEGSSLHEEVASSRRVYVYERCSQFSILQNLPDAYMWVSPMPQRALEQYQLMLKRCPEQHHRMKDVLVYHEHAGLRPEEEMFVELLRRQANDAV